MYALKVTGFAFVASSLLYLAVGLGTYTLHTAEGRILGASTEKTRTGAYPAQTAAAPGFPGQDEVWSSVRYSYEVNSIEYGGRVIGLFLPINLKEQYKVGQLVRVYYLPGFPQVAVLQPGVSILQFSGLLGFGICILGVYSWVQKLMQAYHLTHEVEADTPYRHAFCVRKSRAARGVQLNPVLDANPVP